MYRVLSVLSLLFVRLTLRTSPAGRAGAALAVTIYSSIANLDLVYGAKRRRGRRWLLTTLAEFRPAYGLAPQM